MGLFDKLFGRKSSPADPVSSASEPQPEPVSDGPMMKVFDPQGNEMLIPREQWRDVMLANLENQLENPEDLYRTLIMGLQHGFASEITSYAEYFQRLDPVPVRGSVTLGVFYMESDRLDDAERVFTDFTSRNGEHAVILANLAKLYSRRGDDLRAEEFLWRSLELDPNDDNAVGWYVAIQQHRNGDQGVEEAYARLAALPQSWKARLWVARGALQAKDVARAETLYSEALAIVADPAPSELLLQMSGDLGSCGFLEELVRLVTPHANPAAHGLEVGNNLIKANLELGRLDAARAVLAGLEEQKRPEWHPTLRYWNVEIVKAEEAETDGAAG